MKKTVLLISSSSQLFISIDIYVNKMFKWDAHFHQGVSELEAAINKLKPDILLLDYYNAGIPGEEALKMLMPYKRNAGMSIVGLISVILQIENGEQDKDWNASGLDGYVFKPCSPDELKRALTKRG